MSIISVERLRNKRNQGGSTMSKSTQLKKRTEMNSDHTWALSDLIKDSTQWQDYYNKIDALAKELDAFKGTLDQSPEQLLKCLKTKV